MSRWGSVPEKRTGLPRQCLVGGKGTELGARRPVLESPLCFQVLGILGQVLSSLWVGPAAVSGWGSSPQGYLARHGTEWGREHSFLGPEHKLLVQII